MAIIICKKRKHLAPSSLVFPYVKTYIVVEDGSVHDPEEWVVRQLKRTVYVKNKPHPRL